MPSYQAPVADALFLLNDVLHWDRYNNLPGFADAPLTWSRRFCRKRRRFRKKFCNRSICPATVKAAVRHDDGSVTTPKGFKEAFKAYAEGGWIGLATNPDFGGQGLPYTLGDFGQRVSAPAPIWPSPCIRA